MNTHVLQFFSSQGFDYELTHSHYHFFKKIINGHELKVIATKLDKSEIPKFFRIIYQFQSFGIYNFDQLKCKLPIIIDYL
jgi:hypothetical protein